ncbi:MULTISPECIES: GlcG/HbpS family heme-binding protein [unclassified Polaribacter]|uniref:GlcG/HbpS family heme-binding protein n=1 Tax=unclassified Polaribacter TaxID=196858 RepID=UPI0011BE073D|nr:MULTISPECIES: heme-binding protein [unclassified Polaribacter]TXD53906.1 heme-binding protein [Polaribacter sp. IC063]TXD58524.1 heme-binding protein [Polaribacter sp. IC066]
MKIFNYPVNLLFGLISMLTLYAQDRSNLYSLHQKEALNLTHKADLKAQIIDKNISVAVLNSSEIALLLIKANHVGLHNTKASHKKAYTSLSTKTAYFELFKKAANSNDAKSLNILPELLLLGGGVPIYKNGQLIDSIGVSGCDGSKNDHNIALQAILGLSDSITK